MNCKKSLVLILLLVAKLSQAQHQEVSDKPETWKGKKNHEYVHDSTSLLNAFKNGHFNGHFRYFSMATANKQMLSDYYANAIGGGIKFETDTFHNFQFGVSGFYIFNMGSSDFAISDSQSNQANRYELALFDITDPTNRSNIDRLEELYLKFHHKNSQITVGRQLINTPFINLQDGRMRPTEVQGIWLESKQLKNTKIEGGFLNRISPRSTVEYFSIGQSIGVYATGVHIDGTKSNYKNNLSSNGVFLAGITHSSIVNLKLQAWNQLVHNIFNTTLIQADYKYDLATNAKLIFGFQSIHQNAVKDGGNIEASKAYIEKDSKSNVFGGRIGWANKKLEVSCNYTRITSHGRYLMPREWGRDPFYTFMPRERNEGLGDVNAFVIKFNSKFPKSHLVTNLAAGYFDLPTIDNYRLNKYGMPAYTQFNADVRYEFQNFLKGLDAQFLFVHKLNNTDVIAAKNVINKVDMSNYNLILNYHF